MTAAQLSQLNDQLKALDTEISNANNTVETLKNDLDTMMDVVKMFGDRVIPLRSKLQNMKQIIASACTMTRKDKVVSTKRPANNANDGMNEKKKRRIENKADTPVASHNVSDAKVSATPNTSDVKATEKKKPARTKKDEGQPATSKAKVVAKPKLPNVTSDEKKGKTAKREVKSSSVPSKKAKAKSDTTPTPSVPDDDAVVNVPDSATTNAHVDTESQDGDHTLSHIASLLASPQKDGLPATFDATRGVVLASPKKDEPPATSDDATRDVVEHRINVFSDKVDDEYIKQMPESILTALLSKVIWKGNVFEIYENMMQSLDLTDNKNSVSDLRVFVEDLRAFPFVANPELGSNVKVVLFLYNHSQSAKTEFRVVYHASDDASGVKLPITCSTTWSQSTHKYVHICIIPNKPEYNGQTTIANIDGVIVHLGYSSVC